MVISHVTVTNLHNIIKPRSATTSTLPTLSWQSSSSPLRLLSLPTAPFHSTCTHPTQSADDLARDKLDVGRGQGHCCVGHDFRLNGTKASSDAALQNQTWYWDITNRTVGKTKHDTRTSPTGPWAKPNMILGHQQQDHGQNQTWYWDITNRTMGKTKHDTGTSPTGPRAKPNMILGHHQQDQGQNQTWYWDISNRTKGKTKHDTGTSPTGPRAKPNMILGHHQQDQGQKEFQVGSGWACKLQLSNTHTHIYIYTQIQVHAHTHTHTYRHTHIHTHSYAHTHAYIHKHTYTHTHKCTHTYAHIHIHTHICIHTYTPTHNTQTLMHTHTHKHTHTHNLPWWSCPAPCRVGQQSDQCCPKSWPEWMGTSETHIQPSHHQECEHTSKPATHI